MPNTTRSPRFLSVDASPSGTQIDPPEAANVKIEQQEPVVDFEYYGDTYDETSEAAPGVKAVANVNGEDPTRKMTAAPRNKMTMKLTLKTMPTTAPKDTTWRLEPPSQSMSKPKLKPPRTTPLEKVTTVTKGVQHSYPKVQTCARRATYLDTVAPLTVSAQVVKSTRCAPDARAKMYA